MATIKTFGGLAPIDAAEAAKEIAKAVPYFQTETAAVSAVGETDLFRYTIERRGTRSLTMRVFPHRMNHEFSGEVVARW